MTMDLHETFTGGSGGYSYKFDSISRSIRNINELQAITWRISEVLTEFLTMDLDETFIEGSDGYSC